MGGLGSALGSLASGIAAGKQAKDDRKSAKESADVMRSIKEAMTRSPVQNSDGDNIVHRGGLIRKTGEHTLERGELVLSKRAVGRIKKRSSCRGGRR